MSAGRYSVVLILVLASALAYGESVPVTVRQGNELYGAGDYSGAIDTYDQALVEDSRSVEAKFNKANAYYRLDDLEEAMSLYRQAASESRDMKLVNKARYNLGNSHFQQGIKQRDSDLQKAMGELETSIGHWRQVLDSEPENEKAARNIEVARLIIKDIIDQINKQQDPNQPQDPNQGQQQQQNQQQDPNEGQEQQQNGEQDPNEPEDPNQGQQPQEQQEQEQESEALEETADDILEKERQERKERQLNRRVGYRKVEKDW